VELAQHQLLAFAVVADEAAMLVYLTLAILLLRR